MVSNNLFDAVFLFVHLIAYLYWHHNLFGDSQNLLISNINLQVNICCLLYDLVLSVMRKHWSHMKELTCILKLVAWKDPI